MRQGAPDGKAGPFLDLSAERLQSLQEGDETLAAARRAAEGEMKSAGKEFSYRRGYCIGIGHLQDTRKMRGWWNN